MNGDHTPRYSVLSEIWVEKFISIQNNELNYPETIDILIFLLKQEEQLP